MGIIMKIINIVLMDKTVLRTNANFKSKFKIFISVIRITYVKQFEIIYCFQKSSFCYLKSSHRSGLIVDIFVYIYVIFIMILLGIGLLGL